MWYIEIRKKIQRLIQSSTTEKKGEEGGKEEEKKKTKERWDEEKRGEIQENKLH